MKKLLIPVLIAVFAGVGGGSGFAYMRASKTYVIDSTKQADSLKAHPPATDASAHDSAAEPAHSGTGEAHAPVDSAVAASAAAVEHLPLTPADSLRSVEATRTSLRDAAKGRHDSAVPRREPAAVAPKGATAPGHADPPQPGGSTTSVASIVRQARNDALNTVLPEQRLAKIFAAMSAKDAAKVMEQMPDADVRSILSMMSDRVAAAVLSQFSAARAATITKGSARTPEAKP